MGRIMLLLGSVWKLENARVDVVEGNAFAQLKAACQINLLLAQSMVSGSLQWPVPVNTLWKYIPICISECCYLIFSDSG